MRTKVPSFSAVFFLVSSVNEFKVVDKLERTKAVST